MLIYLLDNGRFCELQRLESASTQLDDTFGFSVDIAGDGSVLGVGARFADDQGDGSGAGIIFSYQ